MSLSLRDQLVAAGLVKDKPPEKHGEKRGKDQRQQAKDRARQLAEQKAAAEKAAAAKAARDQELNRQREQSMGRKARMVQVKQLIEQNRLPKVDGDDYYNFIDGKKVRRIAVDAGLRARLIRGELLIARYEGRYDLVPNAIGERIRERDERSVVTPNTAPETAPAVDDPYKDFVVPDDLKW
ncbi:MAG: hypothetical protein JWR16_3089 [Nevskia sp.]|nr:hypothetical protein [Nevskia sp.]